MDWVIRIESDGVIRWLDNDGRVSEFHPQKTAMFDSPGDAWTRLTSWIRENESNMTGGDYTAVAISNRWLDQMNNDRR